MPFSLLFGKSLRYDACLGQSHSALAKHDNLVLQPAYVRIFLTFGDPRLVAGNYRNYCLSGVFLWNCFKPCYRVRVCFA